MMVREKKREKQYQETMEGLKKEIKKLSELVDKLTENK
jgi:hypothetical protein